MVIVACITRAVSSLSLFVGRSDLALANIGGNSLALSQLNTGQEKSVSSFGVGDLSATYSGFIIRQRLFMLKAVLLSILVSSSITSVYASSNLPVNKYSCSKVESKISRINSAMRSGYSSRQGERLRGDLRDLKKQRSNCKKKKFPTSK